ncbi:MAG TPA: type II toxin-antitoxin system VapC family toxin [Chloroflexota bacterium]|nr:type II toxin-antitoxin system VapC family toxin [Chloroflexota bacterium]
MILLDTHTLIWWVGDRARLSEAAAMAIEGQRPALVSPISFWEIAVLVERGRISVDNDLSRWCRDLIASDAARVATLTPSAAISAARLQQFHGDPADRLIYATAREVGMPLVSKDRKIREYARQHGDVKVIW